MATAIGRRRAEPRGPRPSAPARVARRGAWTLARLINTVAGIVSAVIVLGIVLVVLGANPANDVVNAVLDAGRFLAGPFRDVFSFDHHKLEVAVNWGIAAAVYTMAAGLLVRLLRR
jgi:hypothetical protein